MVAGERKDRAPSKGTKSISKKPLTYIDIFWMEDDVFYSGTVSAHAPRPKEASLAIVQRRHWISLLRCSSGAIFALKYKCTRVQVK